MNKLSTLREKALAAMKDVAARVTDEHRRAGLPLVVWRDGKVAKIPPSETTFDVVKEPADTYTRSRPRGSARAKKIGEKRSGMMKNQYTAIAKKEDNWWIGWIEEVPGVNSQERTFEELMESLRSALREALEFNKQEAKAAAGEDYREELLVV